MFCADYTDQQITRQVLTGPRRHRELRVTTPARSTIQGVELEGAIRFTDRFSATYGIGYTDAEFDKYRTFQLVTNPTPPPATISVPVDLSDTAVFQNTPEWNGNLALSYLHELQRVAARSSAPSAARIAASTACSSSRTRSRPDRGLHAARRDLVWTCEDGRTRSALHGRNLTDEDYKIGGYYFPGATSATS